ncbi:MAG: hypothetical protein AB7O96_05925 [Pseudobdellovibrionaceae bacterium]
MLKLFCLIVFVGTFAFAKPPQKTKRKPASPPSNELWFNLGTQHSESEFLEKESAFFPLLENSLEVKRVEIYCKKGWGGGTDLYKHELTIWSKDGQGNFTERGTTYQFKNPDACFNFLDNCVRPSENPDIIKLKSEGSTNIASAKCGQTKK